MSKYLKILLFSLLALIGCEDEDDTAVEDSLVGRWNYAITRYYDYGIDYDTGKCTGDGEICNTGTMTFTDTEVVFSPTYNACEEYINPDTLSYTYSDALYLSETSYSYSSPEACTEEGGVYMESDSSCTFTEEIYNFLKFDGNTVTLYTKTIMDSLSLFCEEFVLTKQ